MIEFRLYYDKDGSVMSYTCEDLPGDNYIIIDPDTYAIGDPFVRVIEGEIFHQNQITVISKLEKSSSGIKCTKEDVCIITDEEPYNVWEVKTYEYRNS